MKLNPDIMLFRLTRLVTLAATVFLAGACDHTPRHSGTLTATIDGKQFVSDSVQTLRANGALQLTAIGPEKQVIMLQLADASGTGVIYLKPFLVNNYGAVMRGTDSTWTSFANGGSGSVTFATATKNGASGTFAFTAPGLAPLTGVNPRMVVDGKFSVRY